MEHQYYRSKSYHRFYIFWITEIVHSRSMITFASVILMLHTVDLRKIRPSCDCVVLPFRWIQTAQKYRQRRQSLQKRLESITDSSPPMIAWKLMKLKMEIFHGKLKFLMGMVSTLFSEK